MDKSSQKTVNFGNHGVNIRLHSMKNTDQVFWSGMNNSFVMVHTSEFNDGKRSASWLHPFLGNVALFSINGIGEIRWDVHPMRRKDSQALEDREAIDHFGLIPVAGWENE